MAPIQEILNFVRTTADRPLKIKELAKAMRVPSAAYPSFRTEVKRLLASGKLVAIKPGRIGLPENLSLLVGTLSISKGGTGFLVREGIEADILIPPEGLHTALDGDTVMVRKEAPERGREAGVVIKIVERARRKIVGVYQRGPRFNFVKPDDPRIHRDIYIPESVTLRARSGDKVVVTLDD